MLALIKPFLPRCCSLEIWSCSSLLTAPNAVGYGGSHPFLIHGGNPQLSSTYSRIFHEIDINKPSSYWGIPMTMETPYISKKIPGLSFLQGSIQRHLLGRKSLRLLLLQSRLSRLHGWKSAEKAAGCSELEWAFEDTSQKHDPDLWRSSWYVTLIE